MYAFEPWLAKVWDFRRGLDLTIPPPASETEVAELAGAAAQEFGYDLPNTYRAFLRRMDGMDTDGVNLFATREHRPGGVVYGFLENNRILRDGVGGDRYIWYGEESGAFFVHDLTAGDYRLIDGISRDEFEAYRSCEDLLVGAMRRVFRLPPGPEVVRNALPYFGPFSPDQVPEQWPIGLAQMCAGGAIVLDLRRERPDGTIETDHVVIPAGDERHRETLAYLDGLEPGQIKAVYDRMLDRLHGGEPHPRTS